MTTNLSSSPLPTLRDLTLADVVHHFKAGTLTSTQLVRAYLTRIAEVNHEFNSVIEVNPDALAIAQARDTERTQGHYRSMLHGLPILLKDNIPTLDATETTCASLALIGAKPAKEAAVVTALRNAGAVILGKANMAEWVGFRSSSGCSGWSPRGGQTMGPYVKGSKASGSSGGCAVATALGLCFAAIGTEASVPAES
jgi:amidase